MGAAGSAEPQFVQNWNPAWLENPHLGQTAPDAMTLHLDVEMVPGRI